MAAVGAAAGADGRSCRRPSGAVAGLLENVSTNNQYLTDLGRRGGYQAVDSDGITSIPITAVNSRFRVLNGLSQLEPEGKAAATAGGHCRSLAGRRCGAFIGCACCGAAAACGGRRFSEQPRQLLLLLQEGGSRQARGHLDSGAPGFHDFLILD